MTISHRILYGVLFVCGFVFALFCWIGVLLPWGIFSPDSKFRTIDVFLSLTFCGLALSGYFVWVNWLWLVIYGRPLTWSCAIVQGLSLANHMGWGLFLPCAFNQYHWDYFALHPVLGLWLFFNIVIALLELFLRDPLTTS